MCSLNPEQEFPCSQDRTINPKTAWMKPPVMQLYSLLCQLYVFVTKRSKLESSDRLFYESINESKRPLNSIKQSINSSKEAQQLFCFLKSSDQEIWNKTIKHHASTTFADQKTRSQLQNASTVTRLLYINPKNYLIGHLKEAIRM